MFDANYGMGDSYQNKKWLLSKGPPSIHIMSAELRLFNIEITSKQPTAEAICKYSQQPISSQSCRRCLHKSHSHTTVHSAASVTSGAATWWSTCNSAEIDMQVCIKTKVALPPTFHMQLVTPQGVAVHLQGQWGVGGSQEDVNTVDRYAPPFQGRGNSTPGDQTTN